MNVLAPFVPTRRNVFRGVVTLLVALLIAEGAARLINPYLLPSLSWYQWIAQAKIEQLHDFADDDACIGTMTIGSSMTGEGIDPEVLKSLGTSPLVYDAAINSASAEIVHDWLSNHVLKEVTPQAVVMGLAPIDLSGRAEEQITATERYFSSRAARTDWLGRLDRFGSRYSVLVRERPQLRDGEEIVDALRRIKAGDKSPSSLDVVRLTVPMTDRGYTPRNTQDVWQPDTPEGRRTGEFTRQNFLNDYRLGPEQIDAVGEIADLLADRGIPFVIAETPFTQYATDALPGKEADREAFERAMTKLADEHNITFIPVDAALEVDQNFTDPIHLNKVGAAKFSEHINAALADAALTPLPCGEAADPDEPTASRASSTSRASSGRSDQVDSASVATSANVG